MRVSDMKLLMLVMKHKTPYFFLHLSIFNELACCEIIVSTTRPDHHMVPLRLLRLLRPARFLSLHRGKFCLSGENRPTLVLRYGSEMFFLSIQVSYWWFPDCRQTFWDFLSILRLFFSPFSRPSCFSFHPIIIIIITICQRKLLLNKTLPFVTLTSVHLHTLLFTTLPSPRSFFLSYFPAPVSQTPLGPAEFCNRNIGVAGPTFTGEGAAFSGVSEWNLNVSSSEQCTPK